MVEAGVDEVEVEAGVDEVEVEAGVDEVEIDGLVHIGDVMPKVCPAFELPASLAASPTTDPAARTMMNFLLSRFVSTPQCAHSPAFQAGILPRMPQQT
jgi:hypothetical protein